MPQKQTRHAAKTKPHAKTKLTEAQRHKLIALIEQHLSQQHTSGRARKRA
jgi:hypothetical protein